MILFIIDGYLNPFIKDFRILILERLALNFYCLVFILIRNYIIFFGLNVDDMRICILRSILVDMGIMDHML